MREKPRWSPGPDHPITVEPGSGRVVASVDGRTVADSSATLTLREADYPPVHYFPRVDVDLDLLERTAHTTYCPYKGDASYFSVRTDEGVLDNVVWTYEAPYDAVAEIREYVAFYPDRVQITEAG